MIDFNEIADFEGFEDLCEEILLAKGLKVHRMGRGPGQLGKDMIARESYVGSLSQPLSKIWLVEVKFTRTTRSLNERDVPNISDRVKAQEANGYFLFTNATLGVNLERTLRGLRKCIDVMIWRKNAIEKEVLKYPQIFRKFFPASNKKWIKENRMFFSAQTKLCKSPLTYTLASLYLIRGLLENPSNKMIINDKISDTIGLVRSFVDEIDGFLADFTID